MENMYRRWKIHLLEFHWYFQIGQCSVNGNQVYNNIYINCIDSKGIYQNQHNYIIAALFNINTAIGVIRYDSLSVIADMINEDGGITGRLILIKPTLYDDNINNLITAVNRYIDNEDLLCFFGTSLEEERKLINPILEERDKLLFVLDNMGGEVAYRNIIFVFIIIIIILSFYLDE